MTFQAEFLCCACKAHPPLFFFCRLSLRYFACSVQILEALGASDLPIQCAAVCVYPARVRDAKTALRGTKNIHIASVATGFPSGQVGFLLCSLHGPSFFKYIPFLYLFAFSLSLGFYDEPTPPRSFTHAHPFSPSHFLCLDLVLSRTHTLIIPLQPCASYFIPFIHVSSHLFMYHLCRSVWSRN